MSRTRPSARLTVAQKFEESRKSVERLHPGHGKELEKPMYVTWGQIPTTRDRGSEPMARASKDRPAYA